MERISGDKVKDGLKELQKCELDILKKVVKICNDNNLEYYLMGGTFLGAVRHKGFIPWDDDIDISLRRSDYEKLLVILKKELSVDYFIDYYKYNKDSLIVATRIENVRFKIKDHSVNNEIIRNAWIDIFPLDGMPNNRLIREFYKFRLLYLRLKVKYSTFSKTVAQGKKHRALHEKFLVFVGNHINVEKLFDRRKSIEQLDNALKKYSKDNSLYLSNLLFIVSM